MNKENYEIIDDRQAVPDSRELGLEVRRQGQGRSNKDLVFDPVTGEFVIGGDGVRTGGDVVTQMTEDGFAAERYRYNNATGEFEPIPEPPPPPTGGDHGGARPNMGTRGGRRAADSCRGFGWILAGGIVSTFVSSWIGGAAIAYGLARKFDLV